MATICRESPSCSPTSGRRSSSTSTLPRSPTSPSGAHATFNHCTGDSEPLDKFWGWGTVLLADFDDIDKCLADAGAVFDNLRDLHSFDTVSYLSEEQKAVLKRFFSTFDENHESRLREIFLKLWSHFGDVYADFNERLRQQQLAYEGALLRNVVCDDNIDFGPGPYLLVGFNALLPVEQKLFRRLKRESDAHFYWDYDNYYLGNDNHPNEAGTFVSKAIIEFGNELDIHDDAIYANLTTPKRITYIGAPTGNVQARYVGEWLSESSRVEAGNKSAIVMCDETLLPTIVHSITPEVTDLNITTGFPLTHTAAASLVSLLLELRLFGTRGKGEKRETLPLYALKDRVRQAQEPELLPTPHEIARTAETSMGRYISHILKKGHMA